MQANLMAEVQGKTLLDGMYTNMRLMLLLGSWASRVSMLYACRGDAWVILRLEHNTPVLS